MVYVLFDNGFEEIEALSACDILRRGGVEVKSVSVSTQPVVGAHQIPVTTDLMLSEVEPEKMEMVVIPGGWDGVMNLLANEGALSLVQRAWDDGKYTAAICAGPMVLAKLHITDGKRSTCYPGLEKELGSAVMQDADAVQDGRVITGRAPGAAIPFALKLVEVLKGTAAAATVAEGLVWKK